jgi:hypothetical protein
MTMFQKDRLRHRIQPVVSRITLFDNIEECIYLINKGLFTYPHMWKSLCVTQPTVWGNTYTDLKYPTRSFPPFLPAIS